MGRDERHLKLPPGGKVWRRQRNSIGERCPVVSAVQRVFLRNTITLYIELPANAVNANPPALTVYQP